MFVKYAMVFSWIAPGVDFPKHRLAAIDVLAGRNPYVGANYLGFNYPLLTAWIYVFLAWVPESWAERVWDLTNAFYTVASLFVVARFCRPSLPTRTSDDPFALVRSWIVRHWGSFSALILAFFAPVFLEIHDGNIEPLNLFLLTILCAALLRNAQALAGIVLAVLCLVKILPVFFVPVLLVSRKWRTIATWGGAMALYGAVLFATGWWRWEWFLYTRTLPNVGFRYVVESNSLVRIVRDYLAPNLLATKPMYDRWATAISLSLSAAFAVVLWLGRNRARESWRDGIAFASLTVVLVTPLLEYQHLIWSFPAYLFLLADWAERRSGGRTFALGAVLWCGVVAARYVSDLGGRSVVNPLHVATLLVLGLWGVSAIRLVASARVREAILLRDRPGPK